MVFCQPVCRSPHTWGAGNTSCGLWNIGVLCNPRMLRNQESVCQPVLLLQVPGSLSDLMQLAMLGLHQTFLACWNFTENLDSFGSNGSPCLRYAEKKGSICWGCGCAVIANYWIWLFRSSWKILFPALYFILITHRHLTCQFFSIWILYIHISRTGGTS